MTAAAVELYGRLERAVDASSAPAAGRWRSGHPDPLGAIRAAMGEDVVVPAEVLAWWAWHDGLEPVALRDTTIPPPGGLLGGNFLSLSETLAGRAEWLDIDARVSEPDEPNLIWRPSWLPLASSQDETLVADLVASTSADVPILRVMRGYGAAQAPTIADRWTTVVEWWVRLLECGATRWDGVRGSWHDNPALVPADLALNPVAWHRPEEGSDPRFLPIPYPWEEGRGRPD